MDLDSPAHYVTDTMIEACHPYVYARNESLNQKGADMLDVR